MTNDTSTVISEVTGNVAKLASVGFEHEVHTTVEHDNPLDRIAQRNANI